MPGYPKKCLHFLRVSRFFGGKTIFSYTNSEWCPNSCGGLWNAWSTVWKFTIWIMECMRGKHNSTLHKNIQIFFYCTAYACTDWQSCTAVLVHKVNPRLCRGQKKAYGPTKALNYHKGERPDGLGGFVPVSWREVRGCLYQCTLFVILISER